MTISDVENYFHWLFNWPLRSIETPQIKKFFELVYPYTGFWPVFLNLILWMIISGCAGFLILVLVGVYEKILEIICEKIKKLASRLREKNRKT